MKRLAFVLLTMLIPVYAMAGEKPFGARANDEWLIWNFINNSEFFVERNTDLLIVQRKVPLGGSTEFEGKTGFLEYGHGTPLDSRIIHGRKKFSDGSVSFVLESYYPLLSSWEEAYSMARKSRSIEKSEGKLTVEQIVIDPQGKLYEFMDSKLMNGCTSSCHAAEKTRDGWGLKTFADDARSGMVLLP